MKKYIPNNTGVPASSGEKYTGSLFILMRHPNGERRPDLISWNGQYSPKLSIEIKTSRKAKGVMNAHQMHYGFTTEEDYRFLFGEDLGQSSREEISVLENGRLGLSYFNHPVAYYYDVLEREEGLTDAEFSQPYSDLRIAWGDHHLVPHTFALSAFIASDSIRTGLSVDECKQRVLGIIRKNVLSQSSNHKDRTTRDWQNLCVHDIMARFYQDLSQTTSKGRARLEIIQELYPQYEELIPITIRGPRGTAIYVLAEPQDEALFDVQLRRTVDSRIQALNGVFKERRAALGLLDRMQREVQKDLFGNSSSCGLSCLTPKEIALLDRLSDFRAKTDSKNLCNLVVHRETPDLSDDERPY